MSSAKQRAATLGEANDPPPDSPHRPRPSVVARRVVTPDGAIALSRALDSHQALTDARATARHAAASRRVEVLAANRGGASYRVIATALGVSMPSVQHLVDAAKADEVTA